MNKIKYLLSVPRRLLKLREMVEKFQPVGKMGEIQEIMGWKYNP